MFGVKFVQQRYLSACLSREQCSVCRWLNLINAQAIFCLKLPPLGAKAALKSDSSEKTGLKSLEMFCGSSGLTPSALELSLSPAPLHALASTVSARLLLQNSP